MLTLGLLTLSGAILVLAPSALPRWESARRRPLIGLVVWYMVSWSAVVFAALAGAFLAVPSLIDVARLPTGWHACLVAIEGLEHPTVRVLAGAALALLIARVIGCATHTTWVNRRRRARHRLVLSLVAQPDNTLGACVVCDAEPVVYCLPGPDGGTVVFTSAAVERLSASQRAAVVAHERAHLRGRHHLLLASAGLLAAAFPRVRVFGVALEQVAQLVEMHADDVAARGHGRRSVAEALLVLSDIGVPPAVLAATGVVTAARIERLLAGPSRDVPPRSSWAARAIGVTVGIVTLIASPLLLAGVGSSLLCLI